MEIPALGATPTQTVQLNGHHGSKVSVGRISLPRLIVLSAFDKPALQRLLDLHCQWIQDNKAAIKANPGFLQNLAYTLWERRSLLRYRTFAMVDEEDALKGIKGNFCPPIRAMIQPRMVFVFTGQGAQWAGMGRDLLQLPVFHDTVEEANAYLKEMGAGWDVIGKRDILLLNWICTNQHKMHSATTIPSLA